MSGNTLIRQSLRGVVSKHICLCTVGFNSSQVLGSHQLACETSKAKKLKQEKEDEILVDMTHSTTIFSSNRTSAERCNQVRLDSSQAKEKISTDVIARTEAKLDGRNNNRGCYMRHN